MPTVRPDRPPDRVRAPSPPSPPSRAGPGCGRGPRPAGPRGAAARGAARPGHRRAGGTGAVRARGADPAPDDRPAPRDRAWWPMRRDAERDAAGRGARGARPGPRGVGRDGVQPVLPAGEPRRGAAARPRRCASGRGGAKGELDDSIAEAVARLRRDPRPGRRSRRARRPSGGAARAHRASHRGPPADAAPRAAARRAAAGAARRPAHDPEEDRTSGVGCARRSRSCGAPPTCARIAPAPLDEVRTALAFFDETLFGVVPRLYRGLDAALDAVAGDRRRRSDERYGATRRPAVAADAGHTGTRPPRVPALRAVRVVDRRRPRRPPGRHRRRPRS